MAYKSPIKKLPPAKKRYIDDVELATTFGIGVWKLRKLRQLDLGPPYVRFGHHTVRYEIEAVERWIAQQPGGGEQICA